jgi:hypothetical protein
MLGLAAAAGPRRQVRGLKSPAARHRRMLADHRPSNRRHTMTICPIAIAVGCKKCPAFSVCPLKASLGDYKKDEEPAAPPAQPKARKSTKSSAARKR